MTAPADASEPAGTPPPRWATVAVLATVALVLGRLGWAEPFAEDSGASAAGLLEADPLGRFEPVAQLARRLAGTRRELWLALGAHLASTTLVLGLARRLGAGAATACCAALVFGLHPAQVAPVARAAWLGAVLATLFTLLALRAGTTRGGSGRPLATACFAFLGLCSGEHALAGPLAALALARIEARDRPALGRAPLARVLAPWALAGLLWYAARALVFGSLTAGLEGRVLDYGVTPARHLWLRLEVLGGSLERMLLPFDLDPYPVFVPSPPAFALDTWLPLLVLCGWLLALRLARHAPKALLAGLWLAPAALLPFSLRLRTLGPTPLSERILPFALAGFALAAASAPERLLPRALARLAQALLVLALLVASNARTSLHSDETRWLERALELHPDSPEPLWRLGKLRLEHFRESGELAALADAFERYDAALAALERTQRGESTTLATREDHVQANLGLAWCLWYEARLDAYRDWQVPEALFGTIAERYPEVGEARIGMALARLSAEDLEGAERVLREQLEREPGDARARHLLGQIALRRGDFAAAAEDFARASALRPEALEDRTWLARALAEAGRVEEARAVLSRARADHPGAADPLVIEATLEAAAGRFEAARTLVARALELEPGSGEGWLLKGKLHALASETASATTAFQRACELTPHSFEAHHQAAALLLAARGVEAAKPYLLRAYRLRPAGELGALLRESVLGLGLRDLGSLLELADSDLRRGRHEEALEWIELALAVDAERAPVHLARGRVLEAAGRREEALGAFRKACELAPDGLDAHYRTGLLLAALGRGEEARWYLERTLQLARQAPLPAPLRAGIEAGARGALERL